MSEKVIVYIDGFNLYFGLKTKGWKKYYWLDLKKLSESLLKPNQILINTKYFTARISRPADKEKRQSTYIEALETLSDFEIFFGKYQMNQRICKNCGHIDNIPNEKMTDVNIANEMLSDAFQNKFDTAILVSADSDLIPPIKNIRLLFQNKKVIAAFPPERSSYDLKKTAHGWFMISESKFRKSLFPSSLVNKSGFYISKPVEWR